MLLPLVLAVVLQEPQRPAVVRDSAPRDSIRRNTPTRLPVTAAVLASAFRDAAARALFEKARRARIEQDSSLRSYEAQVRKRISVYLGIGRFGREQLAFRSENSATVRWERGVGAHVDVTGYRVSAPLLGSEKIERDASLNDALQQDQSPIPYFPGSETLWIGEISATAEVNDRSLVHPLAKGAEAYYTYSIGDSVLFRLPQGRTVQLRELMVRPRQPRFNVIVGSFWFDVATGQLVRAAFRPSTTAGGSVSVQSDNDSSSKLAPKILSAVLTGLISPINAQISSVTIEYGLFEGRFWLPRLQTAEGVMTAMFARVPIAYENNVTYTKVDAPLGLARVTVDSVWRWDPVMGRPPDSLTGEARRKWSDSARIAFMAKTAARQDSLRKGLKVGVMSQCDTSGVRVITQYRFETKLPVLVRASCSVDSLMHSRDLPASPYEANEDVFGAADRDRLVQDALSIAAQAPLFSALPFPRLQLGPSMTRYNRVEGLSSGLKVMQELGGGYTAIAVGRIGVNDQVANWEFGIARSNLSRTVTLNGYHRLVSANDWGNPLSLGASFSAFFFGRDEGFYSRASGAELLWANDRGRRVEWRGFAEQQRNAPQNTDYSVGGTLPANVASDAIDQYGASVRWLGTLGQDPRGIRVASDLRLEGAGGDSTYSRGALDLIASRHLFAGLDGGVTVAGGSSVGGVPPQRRWFLGGIHTVRGQSADTAQSGNAFWLGRVELARSWPFVRPSLFGDIGWAGNRDSISAVKRPLSGYGIGLSGFDGLIRFDVARGVYPRKQTVVSLYLGGKF